MPSSDQSRLYRPKWIDRQYAKADPSHLKMRPEDSKPEKGTETVRRGHGTEANEQFALFGN
jgi:hypothetical protein